jgi:hypothetical protein
MFKKITLILLTLFSCNKVIAENSKIQNGYEVHYITFSSLNLSKEVAKSYKITRSANRGFINIAVLKQQKDSVAKAVEASIDLKAKNLFGQSKEIELRKIAENDGAIYYVSTFPISSRETINFKATVIPSGSKKFIEIKFSQEFFTD